MPDLVRLKVKMINFSSHMVLAVMLFALQNIRCTSRSDDEIRSRSDIIAVLLGVRAYELGRNITSKPLSAGKIRAAKRYFNDRYFEGRLNLDLAELQAELLATREARKFLSEACEYGLPSYDNLLIRDNFVLSYDNRLKQPVWSLEYLPNNKAMARDACKSKCRWFNFDRSLHLYFRTLSEDYRNSGYNRGHLSPACNNRNSHRSFEQCYKLSNIVPQVKNLNLEPCVWSRLEKYSLYVARRSNHTFIITGTLFLPTNGLLFAQKRDPKERMSYRVISAKRIATPTHFYKVILSQSFDKKFLLEAYLIPNSHAVEARECLDTFRLDIDTELPQIEKLTGLKFFEILNRFRVDKPNALLYEFKDTRYISTKLRATFFP